MQLFKEQCHHMWVTFGVLKSIQIDLLLKHKNPPKVVLQTKGFQVSWNVLFENQRNWSVQSIR